jgi:hypothetical protein
LRSTAIGSSNSSVSNAIRMRNGERRTTRSEGRT